MRLLIDFKQDSYDKLVELLLPEDNCLIKTKLTTLFDREICHLLPIYQKHVQKGSYSWSKRLRWGNFVF